MRPGPRFCAGVLFLATFSSVTPQKAAGQRGSLWGYIKDSAGVGIAGADVGIPSLRRLTRTDDSGRFSFDRLSLGQAELSVRRLGYRPFYLTVAITNEHDSLRIVLDREPLLLATMNVSATEMRRRENVEEFYRRRITGVGQYISRDEVDKRWGGKPSDLLRNTPGLRFVSIAAGKGVRFPTTSINRRDCAPMIWIDGQKANNLEIDEVPLNDIEGIELYSGPSTTPLQFSQASSQNTCGTIVVWSRPPTPRRP